MSLVFELLSPALPPARRRRRREGISGRGRDDRREGGPARREERPLGRAVDERGTPRREQRRPRSGEERVVGVGGQRGRREVGVLRRRPYGRSDIEEVPFSIKGGHTGFYTGTGHRSNIFAI